MSWLESESVSLSFVSNSFDPIDDSPPVSSVHVILQARTLEWIFLPFSRGSSQPRDLARISCIAGGFFTILAIREAHELARLTAKFSPGVSCVVGGFPQSVCSKKTKAEAAGF